MAEIQATDFLQTSVSFTASIPNKFMDLHKKIASITNLRREIKTEKQLSFMQSKLAHLQEKSTQFMLQAEAKVKKLRTEFTQLKLAAIKSERQISIRSSQRAHKIKLLKEMLLAAVHTDEVNLCAFERRYQQKVREIEKRLAEQQKSSKYQCFNLEAKLCQSLPKAFEIISTTSKYQENKLQTIYQQITTKTASLKQNIIDFSADQCDILVYIHNLVAETASQITNDLQNERKQRQAHRYRIIKLVQQAAHQHQQTQQ